MNVLSIVQRGPQSIPFAIGDIPAGTYKLIVWPPYRGGTKEQIVTITPNAQATVTVRIPAPTGRLYVNQMVEQPSTRDGITDEVQSQIVPTLIRQDR